MKDNKKTTAERALALEANKLRVRNIMDLAGNVRQKDKEREACIEAFGKLHIRDKFFFEPFLMSMENMIVGKTKTFTIKDAFIHCKAYEIPMMNIVKMFRAWTTVLVSSGRLTEIPKEKSCYGEECWLVQF